MLISAPPIRTVRYLGVDRETRFRSPRASTCKPLTSGGLAQCCASAVPKPPFDWHRSEALDHGDVSIPDIHRGFGQRDDAGQVALSLPASLLRAARQEFLH